MVTGVNAWRERSNTRTLRSEDRLHERILALEDRVYPDQRNAYVELLTFFESWNIWIEDTEPTFSAKDRDEAAEEQGLPPVPPPIEQAELLAKVQAFGSRPVYDKTFKQLATINEFDDAVSRFRAARAANRDTVEARLDVVTSRMMLRRQMEELADVIRKELSPPYDV